MQLMHQIKTEKIQLKVADGTTMDAYVARPDDRAKHPGLIVFQDAYGVNPHIRHVSERFAKLGYIAIAPELFHRTQPGFEGSYTDMNVQMPHMQALSNDNQLADSAAAYAYLAARRQ